MTVPQAVSPPTTNQGLLDWVTECQAMLKPDAVYWADGSPGEYQTMLKALVDTGVAMWLNPEKRPNSILVRSDPGDVARVEDRTYICWQNEADTGPTNNWRDPEDAKGVLKGLYDGCMQGRTMYVIPYSMGPVGSDIAKIGVMVTDSAYVVANMHLMARVGNQVLGVLGSSDDWVKGIHSVGSPLKTPVQADSTWPCDAENKYITHYPETREIWSYGSGYGGNALLGKKCHALRIASVQAKEEGWMAEHMLILKLTNPLGVVKFVAAAFPSACGKTNLAMMNPTLPGWKVETIGDDIAWLKPKKDASGTTRLFAINPEAGFFGVAPGTSDESNPNALQSCRANAIFTNCALTEEGDVYWEEMYDDEPEAGVDWLRRPWTPDCGRKAAHPNARFTAPANQCPVIAEEWQDPAGVPIDAILFGGRRATAVPLATQAFDWAHGTYMGATMSSEKTAAAAGKVGVLRRDPMAMLPFCGYHMGDYFGHWLKMGEQVGEEGLPKIFYVNWFRKDESGRFLWPGFGENSRVLKWVFGRCTGEAAAVESPIGLLPAEDAIDLEGLDGFADSDMAKLLDVDIAAWKSELPSLKEHLDSFGERLPAELNAQLAALVERLG